MSDGLKGIAASLAGSGAITAATQGLEQNQKGKKKQKEKMKKKKKKKNCKKKSVLTCTSISADPVCQAVAEASSKWSYSNTKHHSKRADVMWISTQRELANMTAKLAKGAKTKKTTRFSKLFGSRELCCKSQLSNQLNIAQRLFPKKFDFWPKTFCLPEERDFLQQLLKRNSKSKDRLVRKTTFIIKPDDGSQGDGIFLAQKPRDLCHLQSSRKFIAQRYISEPMLCDGYKFDLRIYVVITSLTPLRAYLCKEGLVRLATTPYVKPSAGNLSKFTMHLTNYSLNKRSTDFDHGGGEKGLGSKRSMMAVIRDLTELGKLSKPDETWALIRTLVRNTIAVMQPHLKANALAASDVNGGNVKYDTGKCFQIFGFDVVLDNEGIPFLLEVNSNPSMCIDSVHSLVDNGVDQVSPPNLGSIQRRRGGKLCMCKDSHVPHFHKISPIDLAVKSIVLEGALNLVVQNPQSNSDTYSGEGKIASNLPEEFSFIKGHICMDDNYENVFGNENKCNIMERFFTNIALVFEYNFGKRKLNSFKWRKFVSTLHSVHWQHHTVRSNMVKVNKSRQRDSDAENAHARARLADSIFRNHKQILANTCHRAYSDDGITLFITLLVAWAERQMRGDHDSREGLGRVLSRAINLLAARE